MEKLVLALVVSYAIVALSGCTTTKANMTDQMTSAVAVSDEPVAASASTEKTTVAQTVVTKTTAPQPASPSTSPSTAVDVLSNMKKPCSSVAADAPKFVTPETNSKGMRP